MARKHDFLAGIGVGALLMYFFDAERGRGRRVHTSDRLAHLFRRSRHALEARLADAGHRGKGLLAEWTRRFRFEEVSDARLVERVRATMGHVLSEPRAVRVAAADGRVTLEGAVPPREHDNVVRRIRRIPGVRGVDDHLLQMPAGNGHTHSRPETGIAVERALEIGAAPEQLVAFWSRFENFPRFLSHVRKVEIELGTLRSRWIVAGPAGTPLSWQTTILRFDPPRVLAWETLPGAPITHRGLVRFEPTPSGGTRLEVHMSYASAAGGGSARDLFGIDPRQALSEDLQHLKVLFETGVLAPIDSARTPEVKP
jgi:uncharacterized membrane protein